jgi:NAD-dependent DNA ligase
MADHKPIFEGKVFVLQGDLGKSGSPIRSHENITRLIEHHGGEVDDKVTRETTYLICSIKDFNDSVPAGTFTSSPQPRVADH